MSKKDEFVRFEDSWFASVGWTEQEYCRFMYNYIGFKQQNNIALTPWEEKNLVYFKDNRMTQQDLILDYIHKHKSITPFEAFEKLGITKLATRISELRSKGIDVKDVWEEDTNRFGDEVKYKRYFI